MIELRYNKDGKLEYRTQVLAYSWRGWEPYHELDNNVFRKVWNEWIVVPSSVEKSELDQIRESCDRVSREEGILTSLNEEIERITGERDAAKASEEFLRRRERFWFEQYALREEALKKQDARVAQLEAEKQTLLESELWGVNCKPSDSGSLTVEQRRALTRAFDLLCDDDGDNSFAGTIQKMLTANVNFLFLDEKETK